MSSLRSSKLFLAFAADHRRRERLRQELDALARRAGFASCELTCREPDLDVYELRR